MNRDDDDADAELDDCFFPGSDDELGFEEVELEDNEDEMYGTTVTPHPYLEVTFAHIVKIIPVMPMTLVPWTVTLTLMM